MTPEQIQELIKVAESGEWLIVHYDVETGLTIRPLSLVPELAAREP